MTRRRAHRTAAIVLTVLTLLAATGCGWQGLNSLPDGRFIPVGVVYAIWSGTGIVLIALIGWVFLKQALDLPALAGMGLILAGVLVINLFSRTVGH